MYNAYATMQNFPDRIETEHDLKFIRKTLMTYTHY